MFSNCQTDVIHTLACDCQSGVKPGYKRQARSEVVDRAFCSICSLKFFGVSCGKQSVQNAALISPTFDLDSVIRVA